MASPSEGQSSDALVHSTHHEQLDAMVELAQICHFCGTFQAPLKLPVFSRTDLQAALIAGTTGDDREVALLAEVHFKLVREQGAKLERMIQDWERAVARKVTDNWHLEFSSNPFDGATYNDLTVAQRIQVLNALCHWKLESCAEIQKFLSTFQKETDPKALESLRATPIGYDDAGAAYWYFGDCCWVYAEDRPEWQTERCQKYAVEFADAKRIRLSINFDPTRTATVPHLVDSAAAGEKPLSPSLANGEGAAQSTATETSARDKMQITALMDEQIEEDEDEDEPLPITKTEEIQEKPKDADVKPPVAATTPPPPPPPPPLEEAPSQSRKMDITMLCGSPEAADTPPKAEPMEEDERDVSEDRFMSTIVSKRDPVKTETVMNGEVKAPERDLKVEPDPVGNGKTAGVKQDDVPEMKKRRLSEEQVDVKQDDSKQPQANELPAPPKRRKTRFHDIIRVSDNTSQSLGDKVISSTTLKVDTSQTLPVEEPKKEPPVVVDPPAKDEDEDFDIMCAACQRSYDRRYLDPPLENRPAGEWRCFECLVNDARGWPRRRNPTSRSPKGSTEATEEADEASHRKKSPSSSSKRSKSKSSSSKSSSSKKKSSSSRSSSSSSSKKKTSSSSSSSKKSSKKKSKKSSSSSSRHHSSSSHHHHHNRHREGFAKLLTLAQGRKRERLVMEEARLHGAYLHPVSLDGPTGWRVVCCSVEGLRQVIEKLAGGSLEQDRLRGRLILILKVEEKMEAERLKKREQQLWQILPRRQSSRVAMGRIKNQHSGESASETDGDEKDEGGASSDHQRQRSSRLRGETNGHTSRDRLARDRESRAKRRRLEGGSDSDSESDQSVGFQARSVVGWINWSSVKGDTSLASVCSGVIDRLLKEDISELFARPVDPEEDGCPDYLTVIQQPMDLGTIRTRVTSGFYTTWELFKTDVDRVWKNCRQYNSPDTVVVEYADALDEMFKQMRKEAERHGVRKMGKLDVNDGGSKSADEDDDDDELHESSDDNSSMKDGKAKSDSSASEVSSEESDDSSDAGSGDDDDADETSGSKRKTRNRSSGAKATSRVSRSSTARPSRASRSPAASGTKTRPSRSRKAKKDSDSEEEDDDNSGDSDEDEEPDLDSDDSDKGSRSRSSRSRQPRRGAQSSKRASPRRSAPRGVAPPPAENVAKPKPPTSRRNHIDESSESSSSEGSVKGDDSSSSSDSDDAAEGQGEPPAPAPEQPPSIPDAEHDASASASAPPPPSTPPPPPPPLSANNTPPSNSSSGRKPKRPAASSGGRSRVSPTSLLNEFPQSPASSSSYFSSSESESSAGGSDSSDSD